MNVPYRRTSFCGMSGVDSRVGTRRRLPMVGSAELMELTWQHDHDLALGDFIPVVACFKHVGHMAWVTRSSVCFRK